MATSYPAGGTFFETVKRSFTDVPIDEKKDNAISTTEFLEACEGLTALFGVLHPRCAVCTRLIATHRCPGLGCVQTSQERYDGQHQGPQQTSGGAIYCAQQLMYDRKSATANWLPRPFQKPSKTSFSTSSRRKSTRPPKAYYG
jgi:hypothetical protein